ncbi:MAG: T9SS type A sorting domain-containing protein, partial [Candidatus Poribacteria bacterium]|nr:T9SS type A sorting domain-containing protein [Candidatus Poribacteria bacterium]
VRVTFKVTEGSGYVSPYRIQTDQEGFAKTDFTPQNPGTVNVEAAADRLPPVTFTVQVGNPPNKVLRISGNEQKSIPGSPLGKPLVVEVRDINAEPVVGSTVTFTIVAGGGSVSPTTATTDMNGQARTHLTLGNRYGVNSVKASVPGIFRGVTFNATSEVKVLTGAAPHPLMYWIETPSGTLYRLIETRVENLAPNVQNITSLAVDMAAGRLYWGEKTGDKTGRIQGSDLAGKNVQLITELTSVPQSIAIDTARKKLYLTNSWGKVQRLNLDGTNFEPNFITGLKPPINIALDVGDGKIYWTEARRHIGRANLSGNPNIRSVFTGSGHLSHLVVADGKIYWIEQLGQNKGRIRRIGTKDKQVEELVTLRSIPRGIAVDRVDRRLYWTTDRGRIQRANINGQRIQNVARGLISPGDLAIDTTERVLTETVVEAAQMAPKAMALPNETQLLLNYPNPFNPETWIPYHLATRTNVKVSIYDSQGTLVRVLPLGPQPAGSYTSRSRAAHWDGRNALGERVASGIYFYQLQTDEISPLRKMVVLK